MTTQHNSYDYDVCLSFAGEQRDYVDHIANQLRLSGVRVFYDRYETASLWGKDLYEHLDWVYQSAARYCVLFVSSDYAAKVWTSHERRSAQARALNEKAEYILPARFDDTDIPGLRHTVAYVDLRVTTATELVDLVLAKISTFHLRKVAISPSPSARSSHAPGVKPAQSLSSYTGRPTVVATLKPRAGDGPIEVSKNGRRIVTLIPLEGGGRLAFELDQPGARMLADKIEGIRRGMQS